MTGIYRHFCGRFLVRDEHADLFEILEEAEFREVRGGEPQLSKRFTLGSGQLLQPRDESTFVADDGRVFGRIVGCPM